VQVAGEDAAQFCADSDEGQAVHEKKMAAVEWIVGPMIW
jgi:hypothetical protein